VSDVQSDHRQGREDDQPRDAAEYPATAPPLQLAAEYPIDHHRRAEPGGTAGLWPGWEPVAAAVPVARGN
jgi:hypothetical protein